MALSHGYVGVQGRGTVALPPSPRRRYHLDEPGAQVEIIEPADGVFELRPVLPVPATQAWFWTSSWQQREHEVDGHVEAERVTEFADADALLAHVDSSSESGDRAAKPVRRRRTSR